jgi:hypothetical protein
MGRQINVDNNEYVGITFSMPGPTKFAGIRYTGRLASDPFGHHSSRRNNNSRPQTSSFQVDHDSILFEY